MANTLERNAGKKDTVSKLKCPKTRLKVHKKKLYPNPVKLRKAVDCRMP